MRLSNATYCFYIAKAWKLGLNWVYLLLIVKNRIKINMGFQELDLLVKPHYASEKQRSTYRNDNKSSICHEQC